VARGRDHERDTDADCGRTRHGSLQNNKAAALGLFERDGLVDDSSIG